jgi:hypothetical protein
VRRGVRSALRGKSTLLNSTAGPEQPLLDQNSLLGWFGLGTSAPFQVTKAAVPCVTAGNPTFTLAVNDPKTWDNNGRRHVTVHVYRNALQNGGFEPQRIRAVASPWSTGGPDLKGIDVALGYQHSGRNNAFIRTSSREWNALVQTITVRPGASYLHHLRGLKRRPPGHRVHSAQPVA